MTSLTLLQALPEGFLDCGARDLHRILKGPTLIELPGEVGAPLFVSILLHGNEDSGLGAIQRVLRAHAGRRLPRPLMLFVGNVAAAREGLRRLENQLDYNRIWPGAEQGSDTPEGQVMAEVHRRVVERRAFAALDLHNNTGRNPHYGVICTRNDGVRGLAALFAPRAVLFRGLPGTQTASFSGLVPAMTAECGQPRSEANAAAGARFIEAVLSLEELPSGASAGEGLELYHTLGVVKVKPEISLGPVAASAHLSLEPHLDEHNFQPVAAATAFGRTDHPRPLELIDETGRDIADRFFRVENGVLRLREVAIPAMLTLDERIIRQDCLCYLMERLE